MPFRLVSLDGGKSRNAIPRDAHAVVAVAADREADLRERDRVGRGDDPRRVREDRRRRHRQRRRRRTRRATPGREAGTATLLDAVALVPTGPLAMSPDFDGLVETSTSLGEAITEGDTLTLHSLSRSSNDSALPEVIAAPRRGRAPRRRRPRGQAQLRRLAAEPRLARARRRAKRAYERTLRRAADRHRGSRRARDRRDRRQGRRARHDLVRPADRGAAFAGRAREHPDGRALLAAARRRASTSCRSRTASSDEALVWHRDRSSPA